jgi:hypothetical protein
VRVRPPSLGASTAALGAVLSACSGVNPQAALEVERKQEGRNWYEHSRLNPVEIGVLSTAIVELPFDLDPGEPTEVTVGCSAERAWIEYQTNGDRVTSLLHFQWVPLEVGRFRGYATVRGCSEGVDCQMSVEFEGAGTARTTASGGQRSR